MLSDDCTVALYPQLASMPRGGESATVPYPGGRTVPLSDFPGPECSVQWPRSSGNLGNTGVVTAPTVDSSEWVSFNACVTGPDAGPILPECICLDADNDDDVDLHDFAAPQRAFAE